MRRSVASVLVAGSALGLAAPAAVGDIDPVRMTVSAPSKGYVGNKVTIRVTVDADKGAFDPSSGPIRARVKLARLCGGSFEGTSGRVVMDKALSPQPSKDAELHATASTKAKLSSRITYSVCAFVADAEERQFATDDESTIVARKKPKKH